MTTTTTRQFAGALDQVAAVRRFVAEVLDGCPARDEAALLASEAAANAVEHSRSGGASFAVTIHQAGSMVARVEVSDLGAVDMLPALLPAPREDGTRGRGMQIMDALAARWGVESASTGSTVWFEVDADAGRCHGA